MGRYRSRPVVVEAEQWFPGKHAEPDGRGCYPCKPEIFAVRYEEER